MNHEFEFDQDDGTTRAGNPPVAPLIVGSGRTLVKLELLYQGRDILLLVTGGKAHVGAVAVRPAGQEGGRAVVTELSGHREGPLAGECVEILGPACDRSVTAVVGIHQDDATREEITAICANVRQGVMDLAKIYQQNKRISDD